MLQNAEGVSASPLLDDLGLRLGRQGRFATFGFASLTLDRRTGDQLLGWSSRRPRQVVARATVPRRPVGQSKAVTYPPRTPTFRDAMNGVLLQLDIVVYTMP